MGSCGRLRRVCDDHLMKNMQQKNTLSAAQAIWRPARRVMTIQSIILATVLTIGLALFSPDVATAAGLGALAALWGSMGMVLGLCITWRSLGPGAALLFAETCKMLAFIPPLVLGIVCHPDKALFCVLAFAASVLTYRAVFGFQAVASLRQQPTN